MVFKCLFDFNTEGETAKVYSLLTISAEIPKLGFDYEFQITYGGRGA